MIFSAWKTPTGQKENCCLSLNYSYYIPPTKLYTRKDIVIMEIPLSCFRTSFYIPEIQRLEFHLPYVPIIVTHHCGNTRHEAFKYPCTFQDVLG